mmetsp:Transcript_23668/g.29325  ORF Transcript_23668/g.29325 Transcript_23668/m.29325 type:complete len:90 (-) Transcript_23668:3183-3452(-)
MGWKYQQALGNYLGSEADGSEGLDGHTQVDGLPRAVVEQHREVRHILFIPLPAPFPFELNSVLSALAVVRLLLPQSHEPLLEVIKVQLM